MSAVRDRVRRRSGTLPHEIDLGRKAIFFGSSKAYVEGSSQVEPIETHFSWVLLTDRRLQAQEAGARGGFRFHVSRAPAPECWGRGASQLYAMFMSGWCHLPSPGAAAWRLPVGVRPPTGWSRWSASPRGGPWTVRSLTETVSTPISMRLAAAWRDFSPPPRARILSRVHISTVSVQS